jgi:Xaa-Pro aminopeptidase
MLLALLAAAAFAHPTPEPAPELPASVYQGRRERVMRELGGCLALLAAQGEPSGVTETFRQDGDFYWLTGVNEPDAWLLLAPGLKHNRVVLYLKPRDPEHERWTGPRDPISPALKQRYGVDRVVRGEPGRDLLGAALEAKCIAVIAPPSDPRRPRADVVLSHQVQEAFGLEVVFKRGLLGQLRQAHDAPELARMERAIALTRAGHDAAARASVAGVSERDVQTQLEYAFFAEGATGLSYPSIVGSGPDGAVLHWDQNSRLLKPGELVVVDAAAEYGRYAADVTRTYPVSGRFNEEQAKAYRAVYQAQEDVFAAIRPGVSMADLQEAAEASLQRSGYLEYFIHGFGHFVGLDVHDAGSYNAPLLTGAVITVEPGVYLQDRGFGVRIEDEVLITDSGYQLLSKDIPRKLEDVEAWVARVRK